MGTCPLAMPSNPLYFVSSCLVVPCSLICFVYDRFVAYCREFCQNVWGNHAICLSRFPMLTFSKGDFSHSFYPISNKHESMEIMGEYSTGYSPGPITFLTISQRLIKQNLKSKVTLNESHLSYITIIYCRYLAITNLVSFAFGHVGNSRTQCWQRSSRISRRLCLLLGKS